MDHKIWKSFIFLISISYVAIASKPKVQAIFGETADLPSDYKNQQNIPLPELLIFWQSSNGKVLYEHHYGKENQMYINHQYINRTKFNETSWNVHLLNVQIEDQGEYTCLVQHRARKVPTLIHMFTFQLSVTALFTQPEITRLDNKTAKSGDVLNFSCSSNQGYPKPQEIYWVVVTENSTKYLGDTHLIQDNTTQLYNITTNFSLLIPETTTRIDIQCFLLPNGSIEPISNSLIIEIPPSPEGPFIILSWKVISYILASIGIVLFIILILRVIKAKAEDTGHPEARFEALELVNLQMPDKKENS